MQTPSATDGKETSTIQPSPRRHERTKLQENLRWNVRFWARVCLIGHRRPPTSTAAMDSKSGSSQQPNLTNYLPTTTTHQIWKIRPVSKPPYWGKPSRGKENKTNLKKEPNLQTTPVISHTISRLCRTTTLISTPPARTLIAGSTPPLETARGDRRHTSESKTATWKGADGRKRTHRGGEYGGEGEGRRRGGRRRRASPHPQIWNPNWWKI